MNRRPQMGVAKGFFDSIREKRPDYREEWEARQDAIALATNVIRLRRAAGLSQTALAERADMQQPRIADIESVRSNPTLDTLRRIATALGTTASELLRRRASTQATHRETVAMAPQGDEVGFQDGELRRLYRDAGVEMPRSWGYVAGLS